MTNDKKVLLFVYGSLKKGFSGHDLLNGSTLVGEAVTKKQFTLFPAWHYKFPYMVDIKCGLHPIGEVYELSGDAALDALDGYEDLDGKIFVKIRIEVILSSGEEITPLVYMLNVIEDYKIHCHDSPVAKWEPRHEKLGIIAADYMLQSKK